MCAGHEGVSRYGAGGHHQPQHGPGSSWAALHMVKKSSLDEWRPCSDYMALNIRIVTDSYVIPNLHLLNFQLKGRHVFSRLGLVKGYYQVLVNKASPAKTAVVTPFGTFQFNFMPFGLKNAGATIQKLMDKILGDLDFSFVYLDDILISSVMEEEHCKQSPYVKFLTTYTRPV